MQCLGPSFDGFDYLPANETRGGILVAWDTTVMDIDSFVRDTNCLSGMVHNKDGTNWWITVVYGPQGDELKIEFLDELRARREACHGPWMVLGDFNMILRAMEKNNLNLNRRIMRKFREFVEEHELKELYMHDRRFTWTNERDSPTMMKIDRVLVSVDWELTFTDCLLQALAMNVSDHVPLLLSTSVPFCPKRRFRFELYWTKLNGF